MVLRSFWLVSSLQQLTIFSHLQNKTENERYQSCKYLCAKIWDFLFNHIWCDVCIKYVRERVLALKRARFGLDFSKSYSARLQEKNKSHLKIICVIRQWRFQLYVWTHRDTFWPVSSLRLISSACLSVQTKSFPPHLNSFSQATPVNSFPYCTKKKRETVFLIYFQLLVGPQATVRVCQFSGAPLLPVINLPHPNSIQKSPDT